MRRITRREEDNEDVMILLRITTRKREKGTLSHKHFNFGLNNKA